jgi:hypothetical protein
MAGRKWHAYVLLLTSPERAIPVSPIRNIDISNLTLPSVGLTSFFITPRLPKFAGGFGMKRLIPYLVAVAFLLSGTAAAQSNAQTSSARSKTITIFGLVSDDGKSVLAKDSRTWLITNPSMLAGRQGHRVKIKGRTYPDTSDILVLAVKLADAQTQYAANKSDSAFHR